MRRKTYKKWVKRIAFDLLVIVIAHYGIALLISMFRMNAMMFHPHEPGYTWETPHIINIGTPAAPIAAYWRSVTNATATLLYSHGNGEEIGDQTDLFDALAESGMNVLAYDYPGYGLSAGKPTEQGCYDAAECAYAFLTRDRQIPPSTITVHGRSLGTGLACYLAEKYPVKGLIFESGFLSAPRVVTRIRILPMDPFPNSRRIQHISCPKLFIHGTEDTVVAFWHGKKMYERSTGMKECRWVQGAGHNDLLPVLGFKNYLSLIHSFTVKNSLSH